MLQVVVRKHASQLEAVLAEGNGVAEALGKLALFLEDLVFLLVRNSLYHLLLLPDLEGENNEGQT